MSDTTTTNPDTTQAYGRRRRYPIPDERRCEALARPAEDPRQCVDWQRGPHRCGRSGTHERDGHRVCQQHRDLDRRIAYFDPRCPPPPVPKPPKPPIPLKHQAAIGHIELHIEAAERLNRMANAALHARNWKRLARLVRQLADAIDAVHAVEWPSIHQVHEQLTPRANDLGWSLIDFDHAIAQERRSRRQRGGRS